jgi:hypothetical protein
MLRYFLCCWATWGTVCTLFYLGCVVYRPLTLGRASSWETFGLVALRQRMRNFGMDGWMEGVSGSGSEGKGKGMGKEVPVMRLVSCACAHVLFGCFVLFSLLFVWSRGLLCPADCT